MPRQGPKQAQEQPVSRQGPAVPGAAPPSSALPTWPGEVSLQEVISRMVLAVCPRCARLVARAEGLPSTAGADRARCTEVCAIISPDEPPPRAALAPALVVPPAPGKLRPASSPGSGAPPRLLPMGLHSMAGSPARASGSPPPVERMVGEGEWWGGPCRAARVGDQRESWPMLLPLLRP